MSLSNASNVLLMANHHNIRTKLFEINAISRYAVSQCPRGELWRFVSVNPCNSGSHHDDQGRRGPEHSYPADTAIRSLCQPFNDNKNGLNIVKPQVVKVHWAFLVEHEASWAFRGSQCWRASLAVATVGSLLISTDRLEQ